MRVDIPEVLKVPPEELLARTIESQKLQIQISLQNKVFDMLNMRIKILKNLKEDNKIEDDSDEEGAVV